MLSDSSFQYLPSKFREEYDFLLKVLGKVFKSYGNMSIPEHKRMSGWWLGDGFGNINAEPALIKDGVKV